MKIRFANSAFIVLASLITIISCKSGSPQLTPEMQEYRLSETIKELEAINVNGIISSLSSDDSTLIVTVSDNWQAAPLEEQNNALEVLGEAWINISAKIGVKEPELGRLRVVALDRLQQQQARWSRREGVQR
jgi:hypothetical protein